MQLYSAVFFTNPAVHRIPVCLEELLIFLTGPSLLPRLWQGPLRPYSGGRGCSDTFSSAELLFPLGNLCHVSLSCTTDSGEEESTCRCLWVIILGFKALYESQDGDKKTVIFYRSLSVTGSQMYLFFFFLTNAYSGMIMKEIFMEACGITHSQAEFWAKLENSA